LRLAQALLDREPDLRRIMKEVAAQSNLMPDDVLPASRSPHIIDIVHEFYFRGMTETSASAVLLGDISARDHTTVLYGVARWAHIHELKVPRGATGGRYARSKQGDQHGTA
jgi:chromosomal replication initiation ATPase DnaA